MLKINFLVDSDLEDISKEITEYELIWKNEGEKIIQAWETLSGYKFRETYINAVIYGSKGGQSHPLCLKGKCSIGEKKFHLVHELGHRVLLLPRREQFKKNNTQPNSLENHQILYLVLFDVYEVLYGKSFLDYVIDWERKNLPLLYSQAWDFALSFKDRESRQKKFNEMINV